MLPGEETRGAGASESRKSPVRRLTVEERASGPRSCFGCGRDAVVWMERAGGGLLGYCGYLDSGACLALVDLEAGRGG